MWISLQAAFIQSQKRSRWPAAAGIEEDEEAEAGPSATAGPASTEPAAAGMEEDEEAEAGLNATAVPASSVQTVPCSAELKAAMEQMLYDIYTDVQESCQVRLVHLVEEYNEQTRTPASEATIKQASACTTKLHKDSFTRRTTVVSQNTACVWQAATACRLAYVHALFYRAQAHAAFANFVKLCMHLGGSGTDA